MGNFSRRDVLSGNIFQRENKEQVPFSLEISYEGLKDIQTIDGKIVDITLDEEGLTQWINSILVPPSDPTIKKWRVIFKPDQIPEKNSDMWFI